MRLWQLTFVLATTSGKPERIVAGGQLAQEFKDDGNYDVIACEVEASSHKGGEIERRKKKVFARRSEQESQWLRDLSTWVVMANPKPEDPIFTRRVAKTPRGRVFTKKLTAMMIREAVKEMAVKAGLPADRFSSHSLRKGGVTQMSALGASSEDKRDRGNYADGSTVFDTVYDYSTVGLGPLACNANLGTGNAEKPTVEHVSRCVPRR